MSRLVTFCVVAGSFTAGAFAADDFLSHGQPAPVFEPRTFIRGPALDGLSPGTVYVIEFSGTKCAPCIAMIPHLEELQRRHEEVVFLSVFSEPEDGVRRFLDGPGKGITLRVVCDPDRVLRESWSVAAGQFGIPHVFVVDAEGKIAWIGHPWDLDEPLARVAAGELVEAVDAVEEMRRRLVKRERLLWEQILDREHRAEEENRERVTPLIQQGKLEEAIQELDRLIATYHDSPRNVETFRARRLFVLGLMPGRSEEAFSLALELAVDARMNDRTSVPAAAHYVMNHYERCLPENRDERMLHLALALLGDVTLPEGESSRALSDRSYHLQALSRVYELQRDQANASETLRQAIALEEQRYEQLRSENSSENDLKSQEGRIAKLRERLIAP